MEEEDRKDKLSPREITYQVGWSRGTIQPKEKDGGRQEQPGKPAKQLTGERQSAQSEQPCSAKSIAPSPAVRNRDFTYGGLHRKSFAERVVWRGLPTVPASWTTALLWATPAVGFALTYALVLALIRMP